MSAIPIYAELRSAYKVTMDPIKELRRRLAKKTQTALAAELGVSTAYLNDVLQGRREAGEKLLKPLGITRVVIHKRAK